MATFWRLTLRKLARPRRTDTTPPPPPPPTPTPPPPPPSGPTWTVDPTLSYTSPLKVGDPISVNPGTIINGTIGGKNWRRIIGADDFFTISGSPRENVRADELGSQIYCRVQGKDPVTGVVVVNKDTALSEVVQPTTPPPPTPPPPTPPPPTPPPPPPPPSATYGWVNGISAESITEAEMIAQGYTMRRVTDAISGVPGAVAGGPDCTAIIKAHYAALKNDGTKIALEFPDVSPLKFNYSDDIPITSKSNFVIWGRGPEKSILHCTQGPYKVTESDGSVTKHGHTAQRPNGCHHYIIQNLTIEGENGTVKRAFGDSQQAGNWFSTNQPDGNGIDTNNCYAFRYENVRVDQISGAQFMFIQARGYNNVSAAIGAIPDPSPSIIRRCSGTNTPKDSCHMTSSTRDLAFWYCDMYNGGDDSYSLNGLQPTTGDAKGTVRNINLYFCRSRNCWRARGILMSGAENCHAYDCVSEDSGLAGYIFETSIFWNSNRCFGNTYERCVTTGSNGDPNDQTSALQVTAQREHNGADWTLAPDPNKFIDCIVNDPRRNATGIGLLEANSKILRLIATGNQFNGDLNTLDGSGRPFRQSGTIAQFTHSGNKLNGTLFD